MSAWPLCKDLLVRWLQSAALLPLAVRCSIVGCCCPLSLGCGVFGLCVTLLSMVLMTSTMSLGRHPSPSHTSSCPRPLLCWPSSDTSFFSRLTPLSALEPSSFFTFFFFATGAPPLLLPPSTGSPRRAAVAAFFFDAMCAESEARSHCAKIETGGVGQQCQESERGGHWPRNVQISEGVGARVAVVQSNTAMRHE